MRRNSWIEIMKIPVSLVLVALFLFLSACGGEKTADDAGATVLGNDLDLGEDLQLPFPDLFVSEDLLPGDDVMPGDTQVNGDHAPGEDGVHELLPLGSECSLDGDCESNLCVDFADERLCTASCENGECTLSDWVCFQGLCTPSYYCDETVLPDGEGPGCGNLCESLCDPNASCIEFGGEVYCECFPGYDGDGYSCTLGPGPWISVFPQSIEFSQRSLLETHLVEITVSNEGPEPRLIYNIELMALPSQGFAVMSPAPFPYILAPYDTITVLARFRPTITGSGSTTYGNDIEILSDDPEASSIIVPLSGVGSGSPDDCLDFDVSHVDFGIVFPPGTDEVQVALENCGSSVIQVDGFSTQGLAPYLLIEPLLSLPETLDPGEEMALQLIYEPLETSGFSSIIMTEANQGAIAALEVEGGAVCPIAVIELEGVEDEGESYHLLLQPEEIRLSGRQSYDPSGGALEYHWQVDSPLDEENIDILPSDNADEITFQPAAGGRYEVSLEVESQLSGLPGCSADSMSLDVYPSNPAFTVNLEWDNWATLDLHLIRTEEGEPFPGISGSSLDDVNWMNPFPDWGDVGDYTDNPWLFMDDEDGLGPETILLPELESGYEYWIAVHYALALGTSQTTASLEIVYGDASDSYQEVLLEEDQIWLPVVINKAGEVELIDSLVD